MQMICKVKKPSVSISSKLNVALMEAACSKSRPPRAMTAQEHQSPPWVGWTQDVVQPSTPLPGQVLRLEDLAISGSVNLDVSEDKEETEHPP